MQNNENQSPKSTANEEMNPAEMSRKLEKIDQAFDLFEKEAARLDEKFQVLQHEYDRISHEHQEKLEELSRINRRLHNLMYSIRQGLIFLDAQGCIMHLNPAAEAILKCDEAGVLQRPFWEVFPNDLLGFDMYGLIEEGNGDLTKLVNVTIGEARHQIEVEPTWVYADEDREVKEGLILLLRDVTSLRRLEMQLEREDRIREIGALVSSISHEMRNPLGAIKGFAGLLVKDLEDQPKLLKLAEHVVEGADTLNHQLTQILNHTRPLEFHRLQINLKALLGELEQWMSADEAIQENIRLEIRSPDRPIELTADPQHLRAALHNLLLNGAQAMPNGGLLTLTLEENADEILISIEDRGVGIPSENLKKVFVPFFSTKHKGTGLGLSEAKRIIEGHAGTLSVTSKEGQGSRFVIRLPRRES